MRRHSLFTPVCVALALVASACGGVDGTTTAAPSTAFFPAGDADRVAHAILPTVEDLPGSGWTVTARDDFDDDSDDDFDLEAFARQQPECSELSAFPDLGLLFGDGADDDEDLRAGRAQVEFEDASVVDPIPPSVQVEVEILATVSAIQDPWALVSDAYDSRSFQPCVVTIFERGLRQTMSTEPGFEVTVIPRIVTTTAPNDGMSMAFGFTMQAADTQLDMAMEVHQWPYGNAGVTVTFIGTPETLSVDTTRPTLDVIAANLEEAAEEAEAS